MRTPTHRGLVACAVGVVLGLGLGACGEASSATSGSKDEPISIAFLGSSNGSYEDSLVDGATSVAEAEGGSVTSFIADLDPQKQTSQCLDAIASQKYQGLLIETVSNAAIVSCVQRAAAAGLKVVGVSNPLGPKLQVAVQLDEVSGQVVLDYERAGSTAGKLMEQACGGTDCKVAFMIAVPGFPASEVYKSAFEKEIESHPNIRVVQTYPTGYGDLSKAKAALQDALIKHPDLRGVVSDAGWLAGAEELLRERGLTDQVKVVAGGGATLGIEAIKQGRQYGDVPYLPMTMGKTATDMIVKAIRGEQIEEPSVDAATLSKFASSGVTMENVDEFEPEW
jgi:ABC-type sugar transport system substrate-binding protein